MTVYLAVFATAVAAFLGAPFWTLFIGAAVLAAISAAEQSRFAGRSTRFSSSHIMAIAIWQSAGHALLASGAAYSLGYVTRATM
jgi:membrane glycosyltransferase